MRQQSHMARAQDDNASAGSCGRQHQADNARVTRSCSAEDPGDCACSTGPISGRGVAVMLHACKDRMTPICWSVVHTYASSRLIAGPVLHDQCMYAPVRLSSSMRSPWRLPAAAGGTGGLRSGSAFGATDHSRAAANPCGEQIQAGRLQGDVLLAVMRRLRQCRNASAGQA